MDSAIAAAERKSGGKSSSIVNPVVLRGRARAPDRLRERGKPSAGARQRSSSRNGRQTGAGRLTQAPACATSHREPAAVVRRRNRGVDDPYWYETVLATTGAREKAGASPKTTPASSVAMKAKSRTPQLIDISLTRGK